MPIKRQLCATKHNLNPVKQNGGWTANQSVASYYLNATIKEKPQSSLNGAIEYK